MAEGDQTPGGQGGGRTYSEEDVMTLMNEAAKRAASEAVKKASKEEENDDAEVSVINPKVVKQLKDTVAVFTALKELSSNPLQKTIEETVGGMAASVVQNAFAPRGPPPKKDIVDTLLNSQFAYGLGSGLGQRAPELVETMGRTFGTDKAGQMMDSIIGKYGGGGGKGGPSRQITSSGPPIGPTGTSSTPSTPPPEQKAEKQSEKELLLSLDPNNPEHVSAYAETQGGLPIDVARKMLMIHQDAFIEQLKKDGMNVDQISTQRGSHTSPAQQPIPTQQTGASVSPISPPPIRQDAPPTYPNSYPTDQPSQPPDDIEYTEYNDITQKNQPPDPQPNKIPSEQDGQQVEMMKTFANDVGKVMGEMLNKIESLNNTVFTMQSEMNDIKKQGTLQQPPTGIFPKISVQEPSPDIRIAEPPPGIVRTPHTVAEPPPGIVRTPSGITYPMTEHTIPIGTPSLETFEDQIFEDQIESPKVELNIERSGDFFEEDVVNINSTVSKTVQLPVQPIPPPVVQEEKIDKEKIKKEEIEKAIKKEEIEKAIKEEKIDKEKIKKEEIEKAIKEEKIEKEIPIIPEDKTSEGKTFEDKNNDKTPIKKVGVHKKATFRNLKPSFKKNDNKETNIDKDI